MTVNTQKLLAYETHLQNKMNAVKTAYDLGICTEEYAKEKMYEIQKILVNLDSFYSEFKRLED